MKVACEACGEADTASLAQLACLDPPRTEWPDIAIFRSPMLCPRCRTVLLEVIASWPQLQALLAQGVAV
jgi:hypothetical protein